MKLNKKGITLVEIIISIALISIVLIFLFSLLVQVNDMNDEATINSTYLITKSLMLKNIESDLIEQKEKPLKISTTCKNESNATGIQSFYTSYNETKSFNCIQIHFQDETDAYLAIYYYQPKENYVISYIHGNVKTTRELPEFDGTKLQSIKFSSNGNLNDSVVPNNGFYKIEVPIFGPDGKDYSIIIPFYGTVTT